MLTIDEELEERGVPLADRMNLLESAWRLLLAGISVMDLEAALKLLNLDCAQLRKARQDPRNNVNAWIEPLVAELLVGMHLEAKQRRLLLEVGIIATRLKPNASGYLREFWSIERAVLGADAETWVANNQRLFV